MTCIDKLLHKLFMQAYVMLWQMASSQHVKQCRASFDLPPWEAPIMVAEKRKLCLFNAGPLLTMGPC